MKTCMLTSDTRLFASIQRYFHFVAGEDVVHLPVPSLSRGLDPLPAFGCIAEAIERLLAEVDCPVAVLVDPCVPSHQRDHPIQLIQSMSAMAPISYNEPAGALVSMLILAFPEILWVFWSDSPTKGFWPGERRFDRLRAWQTIALSSERDGAAGLQTLRETLALGPVSLFDPTGLRAYLLSKKPEAPGRRPFAAALDEEEPYAYFHGYLSYKLGYLAYVVTTEEMATRLFASKGSGNDFEFTFQDIYLAFPDHVSSEPQSDLKKRFGDAQWPGLYNVRRHFFVTVGHRHSAAHRANVAFMNDLKAQGRARRIFKPSAGIFDVLKETGLLKEYWRYLKNRIRKTKPGTEKSVGHSAPGRLLVVAERLISRAERILDRAQTVQECIRGATLALDALALLRYQTPTTALEAIALRHQLEVKAECMFYGVAYNIDVKARLREIDMETRAVARWFHRSVRKPSLLNAQMSVVTDIARIFRHFGQFDEEQACLRRLRDLNRQWYFLQHPWWNFFRPVRWYVEKLVGSFKLFAVMIIVWPVLFGVLSKLLQAVYTDSVTQGWRLWSHVVHAYMSFFGLQPVEFPVNPAAKALMLVLVLVGFLHLGIFIAHLYTLITRR